MTCTILWEEIKHSCTHKYASYTFLSSPTEMYVQVIRKGKGKHFNNTQNNFFSKRKSCPGWDLNGSMGVILMNTSHLVWLLSMAAFKIITFKLWWGALLNFAISPVWRLKEMKSMSRFIGARKCGHKGWHLYWVTSEYSAFL